MMNSGVGSAFEDSDDELHARIQSAFSRNRRTRPPPINTRMEDRVPLRKELQKRASKFGLQGMFNRSKLEIQSSIISPVFEEATPPLTDDGQTKNGSETSSATAFTNPRPAPEAIYMMPKLPATPSKPAGKSSRMSLRSKSVKESKPVLKASPKSSTKTGKTPTRTSPAWDPPPLFQAYPQAIKHATLSASTLSADSILRISNHRRNSSIRDDIATGTSRNVPALTAAAKRTERVKNRHRRQMSDSISKAEWTRKIYILVTSGYLLQYAGDGSFDRLPEKMMQLGKDSVAFASDVIPGKHWVLQISQSIDADGTPTTDSRSLLSRLAFRGTDYRRTATSFLLVLNSAEDLDSWIAAVRREIEALGGKKNFTETGKPKSEETIPQLKTQPNHKIPVQRESLDQLSTLSSPHSPSFGVPSWTNENLEPDKLADAVSAYSKAQSPFNSRTESHHSMTTLSSHDGYQLDSLRDGANRFSYMSSGQRTYLTNESSSPPCSPARDSFSSTFDENPLNPSVEDIRPRPNALAINERRRSMQALRNPVHEPVPTSKFRPHSTYDVPSRVARSKSPSPNFSLPNSSRQRPLVRSPTFGQANAKFPALQNPPATTYVTKMPVRPREPVLKGSTKSTPTAFNVTRPLSPVKDTTSPKEPRSHRVMTPIDTSLRTATRNRESVINMPPRSPRSPISQPSSTSRAMSPIRVYGYPHNPPETLLLDFQLPRRLSNTQKSQDGILPSRFRREATPPETLTTSMPSSPFITQFEPQPQPQGLGSRLRHSVIEKENHQSSPLRQPTSRHAHATAFNTPLSTTRSLKKTTPSPPSSLPHAPSSTSPLQRLRIQSNPKVQLTAWRSMPVLANGPPPAPPPNYALPPLPPPEEEGMESQGMMNSVRA